MRNPLTYLRGLFFMHGTYKSQILRKWAIYCRWGWSSRCVCHGLLAGHRSGRPRSREGRSMVTPKRSKGIASLSFSGLIYDIYIISISFYIYNSSASVQSRLINVILCLLVGSFVCACMCESLNVFFVMDVHASFFLCMLCVVFAVHFLTSMKLTCVDLI